MVVHLLPPPKRCGSVAEWLGCWTCDQQVRVFESWPPHCRVQPWACYVPVTKQYNLVPAGNVTVGLALHWPHITDVSGFLPMGSRPRRGRWAPAYTRSVSGVWWTVIFLPLKLLRHQISFSVLSVCVRFSSITQKVAGGFRENFLIG